MPETNFSDRPVRKRGTRHNSALENAIVKNTPKRRSKAKIEPVVEIGNGTVAEIGNLMTARCAGGYQDGAGFESFRGRQEAAVRNGFRYFIAMADVAERSGHTAAAGVQLGHDRRRDSGE